MVLCGLGLGLLGPQARAAVPDLMSVQGVLRDASGLLLSGTYDVTFALYDAPKGGGVLWAESYLQTEGHGVAVEAGVFDLVLGALDPAVPIPPTLFAEYAEVWVGIHVGGDPELPRQRLLTAPYAFASRRAELADAASDLACSGCVEAVAIGFGHADLPGLEADDHPQYLRADGSRALSGSWDLAGQQLLNLVVHNAASGGAPADPAPGQLWWDTTEEALKVFDSAQWVAVGNPAPDVACAGCVEQSDIGEGAITSAHILDGEVLLADLGANGCQEGQGLKRNPANTAWECADDANTTYSGLDFALSEQVCGGTQKVRGIDAQGEVICDDDLNTTVIKDANVAPDAAIGFSKLAGVAAATHDHDTTYSQLSHDHDTTYSQLSHDHAAVYEPLGHDHEGTYSQVSHGHEGAYSQLSHGHEGAYSQLSHGHEGAYSQLSHAHAALYEPLGHNHNTSYSQLTHAHAALYEPLGHSHPIYSHVTHAHSAAYEPLGHSHNTTYSQLTHAHDTTYSQLTHAHATLYEPLGHNHTGTYSAVGHGHDHVTSADVASDVTCTGCVENGALAQNALSVLAGAGLSGGGSVALGGSVTLSLASPVTPTRGGTGTVTAFTAGAVVYTGAAGVYAQDPSNFYYSTATARLGLGTAAPAYRLHAVGDVYADGGWLRVSGSQGLYFESFGGGWRMIDSTWIRSYNNKPVYMEAGFDTAAASAVGCGTGLGGGYTFRTCGASNADNYYADNWFRNINTGVGLYNQTTLRAFYSESASYWAMDSGNGLMFRSGYNGTIVGRIYWDGTAGSNNFGLLAPNGSWRVRTDNAGVELYGAVNFQNCRICIYYGDCNGDCGRRTFCTRLEHGAWSGFMGFLGDVNSDDIMGMRYLCDGGASGVWTSWEPAL
jgi:hypothetical protein